MCCCGRSGWSLGCVCSCDRTRGRFNERLFGRAAFYLLTVSVIVKRLLGWINWRDTFGFNFLNYFAQTLVQVLIDCCRGDDGVSWCPGLVGVRGCMAEPLASQVVGYALVVKLWTVVMDTRIAGTIAGTYQDTIHTHTQGRG